MSIALTFIDVCMERVGKTGNLTLVPVNYACTLSMFLDSVFQISCRKEYQLCTPLYSNWTLLTVCTRLSRLYGGLTHEKDIDKTEQP